MSSFKIEGFDKLQKQLKKMESAAKSLNGTHEYGFDELFPPKFMSTYTEYSHIDEFLSNCGYPASNTEEFAAIPDGEFDNYVRKVTDFSSWKVMLETATGELISRKLGI